MGAEIVGKAASSLEELLRVNEEHKLETERLVKALNLYSNAHGEYGQHIYDSKDVSETFSTPKIVEKLAKKVMLPADVARDTSYEPSIAAGAYSDVLKRAEDLEHTIDCIRSPVDANLISSLKIGGGILAVGAIGGVLVGGQSAIASGAGPIESAFTAAGYGLIGAIYGALAGGVTALVKSAGDQIYYTLRRKSLMIDLAIHAESYQKAVDSYCEIMPEELPFNPMPRLNALNIEPNDMLAVEYKNFCASNAFIHAHKDDGIWGNHIQRLDWKKLAEATGSRTYGSLRFPVRVEE